MLKKSKKLINLFTAITLLILMLSNIVMLAADKQTDSVQLPVYTRKLMDFIKSTPVDTVSAAEADSFSSKRLIVKMKSGKVKETYGAKDTAEMPNGITVLQYKTEVEARNAYEQFNNDKNVKYCIVDTAREVTTNLITDDTVSIQAEETEARAYVSWGTERVGADKYMKTLPDAEDLPEVIVAVLDTGADFSHPFIKDRLLPGYDFCNDDADPSDDHMHGTFCAGIVADATKENVKIMPVKLINNEGKTHVYLSTDMAAVVFAVDNGADIISMSFGSVGKDKAHFEYYNDIISYATERDVLCVAAMGNYMNDHDQWQSLGYYDIPSMVENVLSVGATGKDEALAEFSDYGSDMELVAPGVNIGSSMLGGGYVLASGTSASTPLVAACAALLLSRDPDMTRSEVFDELCKRAADKNDPGKDVFYGYGRVDLGEKIKLESMHYNTSERHLYVDKFPKTVSFEYPEFNPINATDTSTAVYSTNTSVARICDETHWLDLEVLSVGRTRIVAVSTDGEIVSYFDLNVYQADMPKLNIKKLPNKTEYVVGEVFDSTGMELEFTARNLPTQTITEGYFCENVLFDSPGVKLVKVKYQGLTCTLEVVVYDDYKADEDTKVDVTAVELDDSLTLNLNDSALLTATVLPDNATNKNIIWTTSNKSVATIDRNGKVTAVGRGTAIITATTEDGGFTSECEVTVKFTWWQWILYIFFFGFIWM